MVIKFDRQNRFNQTGVQPQGVGAPAAQRTKGAEQTGAVKGADQLRFSKAQASTMLGASSPVMARRITTEEFIEKVKQAKEQIVNAPRFDIAFQEQILNDPILSNAFGGYLELIRAGQLNVGAEKALDAEVVFNRQQVVQFLETFQAKLEDLKLTREATPVNLTQLGLQLIQRNGDIQETVAHPLEHAATLRQMSELKSLDPEQRKSFLLRLAKAAVQEVSVEANRTPETRQAALEQLEYSLRNLVGMGETNETFRQYLGEAQRLAKELDGPTGNARKVQVEAIRLSSPKEAEQKAAGARIEVTMRELLATRNELQKKGQNLDGPQLETFTAVLEASKRSKALFAQMPAFIEAVTGAPQDAEGKAADYKPSAHETKTKQAMVATFVGALGTVYPKLEDKAERAAHLGACEEAQGLILQFIGTDQSTNIAALIGQLTRHPDQAAKALEMLSADFIPKDANRLNAAAWAIGGLLENRQIDLAYNLFHDPVFEKKDAQSLVRQGNVFVKATRTAIETKMDVKAGEPAIEWLATSHLRVVEASTGNPHNLPAVKEMLKALTDGDFKLDGQSAADLVGKIQQTFQQFNTLHMDFLSGMVALLAQHPESEASMKKAKELLEHGLGEINQGHKNQVNTQFNGQNYPFDFTKAAIDLLQTVSKSEQLSGFIKPIAEALVRMQAGHVTLGLADRIAKLGPYADKDELARSIPVGDAQLPMVAMSLATDVATTQYARELIAKFADKNFEREIKDLEPQDRGNFLVAEAAARLAVPNLITGKALVGLVKAFQAREVPQEALQLAKTQLPKEIIEQVLGQIDSAEIRDFLMGRGGRKARNDQGAGPDNAERLPVAVVQGEAKPPKDD
jgi:hypothetical protein